MKKFFFTILLLTGISAGMMAQKNTGNPPGQGNRKAGVARVDANKNNVCDNYENRTAVVTGRGPGYGRRAGYDQGRGQGRCGNNGAGPCRRRS